MIVPVPSKRLYDVNSAADAAAIGFDDAAFHAELQLPPERLLADEARSVFTAYAAAPNLCLY